jgi:integrase
MNPAVLSGGHSHSTRTGATVHVYRRGDQYLARGRHQGRFYGETLGGDQAEATARLREILVEIDNDSYVRPSERRKRLMATGRSPRLSVRQLIDEFLAEKRKLRGLATAGAYRARLRSVLDFAEQPAVRQRWPLAMDIDHNFIIELRAFLHQYRVTPNGRAGASAKLMSSGQVVNVMQCLRTLLAWARQADVRKLPVTWSNPLTLDLVGSRPAKDPFREDKLPLNVRIQLVGLMDPWQLCHLTLSVVLPLRPAEAVGLLVSDVDLEKRLLQFGTRFDGGDYTKGRTSFKLPFPEHLRPLLVACIGGRAEGPLLRSRVVFEGRRQRRCVSSREELARLYQEKLGMAPLGSVQADQDRKRLFRQLLRQLGGATEDHLAGECKMLLKAIGKGDGVSLYTLRGSVTTTMDRARLPFLELRYLTSHSTADILNVYAGLDPVTAMEAYFDMVRPLLDAIEQRAQVLGIT